MLWFIRSVIGGERFETDETTVSSEDGLVTVGGSVDRPLAKQLVVQLAFDTTSGYQGASIHTRLRST